MKRLSEKLMLPMDVCRNDVKLYMTGNKELYIENFRGIIEYTDQFIILKINCGFLKIHGCGLNIAFYTNEDMKVVGCMQSIEFDKEPGE